MATRRPVRQAPDAARLREVLAIENPVDFVDQFFVLSNYFTDMKVEKWPPLFRAARGISHVDIAVDVGDISDFFTEWPFEIGAYAVDVASLLREIGVPEAASVIDDCIALYPGGKVPPKQIDRSSFSSDLYDERPEAYEPLTRRYAKVMKRIAPALQRYLRSKEERLLAELGLGVSGVARARSMESLDEQLALVTEPDRVKRGVAREHVALCAISERVVNQLDRVGEEGLTVGERIVFVLFQIMHGDVLNGGLHQFLSNSSGDWAEEAKGHLRVIGATTLFGVLSEVSELFPGGVIPTDREERNAVLDQLDAKAEKRIDTLTDAYYAAENTEFSPKLLAWIAKNKSYFVDAPNGKAPKAKKTAGPRKKK